jgi:nucleotide-binding universal stress UspA family protein
VTITTDLITGSPRHLLAAATEAASLLVVGAYGMGGYAQPGASPDTRYGAAHASCPVAVIRDPGGIEHGEIAVGVRNVDDAQAALRLAWVLTAYTGFVDLTVVGRRDDRGGSGHGSTVRALLNHAQAPVVIAPSGGSVIRTSRANPTVRD